MNKWHRTGDQILREPGQFRALGRSGPCFKGGQEDHPGHARERAQARVKHETSWGDWNCNSGAAWQIRCGRAGNIRSSQKLSVFCLTLPCWCADLQNAVGGGPRGYVIWSYLGIFGIAFSLSPRVVCHCFRFRVPCCLASSIVYY